MILILQSLKNIYGCMIRQSLSSLFVRAAHKRLSNFLLFHVAYSELYFLDCMWPDLTEADLEKAIAFYAQSERNVGV